LTASESFAGITVPQGEPDALHGAAARFRGLSGALEGVKGQLGSLPGDLTSWQGMASLLFVTSLQTTASAADAGVQALGSAAGVASRLAHDLEQAQRSARLAIEEARTATTRINTAQAHLADATRRGQAAAVRGATAAATLTATSLTGAPSPAAAADAARAQQDLAQAQGDGARAQGDLSAAEGDLHRAQAQGKRAELAAHQATTAAAHAFWAIAGASPTPVAAGPPAQPSSAASHPKKDDGFLSSAWHGLEGAASDFAGAATDTAKGLGDFAVGLKDVGVMAVKLTPTYGLIDPAGQQQELNRLANGAAYAFHHPLEFGKTLIDWKDITGGHPFRAFGQLAPNIALAAFSGGGGLAAKGADAAGTLSKLGTGADAADALGGAGVAAKGADPAGALGSAGHYGPITRDEHLANLRQQADALGLPIPKAGMTVQRTYGEILQPYGVLRGSGPFGESWSPVPIEKMTNPRSAMGLPPFNGGRFMLHGTLDDPAAIREIRPALPWDAPGGYHMDGGSPELVIPDAHLHVRVHHVEGVNPGF